MYKGERIGSSLDVLSSDVLVCLVHLDCAIVSPPVQALHGKTPSLSSGAGRAYKL